MVPWNAPRSPPSKLLPNHNSLLLSHFIPRYIKLTAWSSVSHDLHFVLRLWDTIAPCLMRSSIDNYSQVTRHCSKQCYGCQPEQCDTSRAIRRLLLPGSCADRCLPRPPVMRGELRHVPRNVVIDIMFSTRRDAFAANLRLNGTPNDT
jgi:hypothetical protein